MPMKTLRDPSTVTGRARTKKTRPRTDVISKEAERVGLSHTAGGISSGAAVLESSVAVQNLVT